MRPEAARLVFRHEAEAGSEKQEDVRGLRNHQLAGFQERRRERGILHGAAFQKAHHGGHAPLRETADVHVVRAGVLQREPDKLAAALYLGPVIQLVEHVSSPVLKKLRLFPERKLALCSRSCGEVFSWLKS